MQKQLQKPSNSAATPRQQKDKKKLEFSKRLTIVDIICWGFITTLLLVVMLIQPGLAQYCVSIFTTATAAYVSLRLGYTAKAGVENYKKISQTYTEIAQASENVEANG